MAENETPVTPETEQKVAPNWFGWFLAVLVAYVVVGPSLGFFVPDFIASANRIFDMAFGALLTLYVTTKK